VILRKKFNCFKLILRVQIAKRITLINKEEFVRSAIVYHKN
jgi:hypothetical protein